MITIESTKSKDMFESALAKLSDVYNDLDLAFTIKNNDGGGIPLDIEIYFEILRDLINEYK